MTAAEKPGSNRSGLPPRHQAPSLQPALLNSQVQQAATTRDPRTLPTRVPDPTFLTPQPIQTDRPITPPPPLVVNRPPTPTVLSGSTAEAHAAVHTAAEGALAHFPTDTALKDSSTNDHRRSTANAHPTVNTETHPKQQPAKPHRLEEAIAGFSPHTSLEDTRNILAFNEQGLVRPPSKNTRRHGLSGPTSCHTGSHWDTEESRDHSCHPSLPETSRTCSTYGLCG